MFQQHAKQLPCSANFQPNLFNSDKDTLHNNINRLKYMYKKTGKNTKYKKAHIYP